MLVPAQKTMPRHWLHREDHKEKQGHVSIATNRNQSGTRGKRATAFILDQASKLQYTPEVWYLDSGATHHMTPCKKLLSNFVDITPFPVFGADINGKAMLATGKGTASLDLQLTYSHLESSPVLDSLSTSTLKVVLFKTAYKKSLHLDPTRMD